MLQRREICPHCGENVRFRADSLDVECEWCGGRSKITGLHDIEPYPMEEITREIEWA